MRIFTTQRAAVVVAAAAVVVAAAAAAAAAAALLFISSSVPAGDWSRNSWRPYRHLRCVDFLFFFPLFSFFLFILDADRSAVRFHFGRWSFLFRSFLFFLPFFLTTTKKFFGFPVGTH